MILTKRITYVNGINAIKNAALFHIGLCYHDMGNYPEAEKYFRATGPVSEYTAVPTEYYAVANTLFHVGKLDEAEQFLHKNEGIFQKSLDKAGFCYLSGEIAWKQGRKDDADAAYKKAVEQVSEEGQDNSILRRIQSQARLRLERSAMYRRGPIDPGVQPIGDAEVLAYVSYTESEELDALCKQSLGDLASLPQVAPVMRYMTDYAQRNPGFKLVYIKEGNRSEKAAYLAEDEDIVLSVRPNQQRESFSASVIQELACKTMGLLYQNEGKPFAGDKPEAKKKFYGVVYQTLLHIAKEAGYPLPSAYSFTPEGLPMQYKMGRMENVEAECLEKTVKLFAEGLQKKIAARGQEYYGAKALLSIIERSKSTTSAAVIEDAVFLPVYCAASNTQTADRARKMLAPLYDYWEQVQVPAINAQLERSAARIVMPLPSSEGWRKRVSSENPENREEPSAKRVRTPASAVPWADAVKAPGERQGTARGE